MSQTYQKFRVPHWVLQLIRGLPAWFIAMHSLTIHHLLAPLIILAKDNYTAQRCGAQRTANGYLTTWTTTLGGEGETSVQVWPRHQHGAHAHVGCVSVRSVGTVQIQLMAGLCFFILLFYCWSRRWNGYRFYHLLLFTLACVTFLNHLEAAELHKTQGTKQNKTKIFKMPAPSVQSGITKTVARDAALAEELCRIYCISLLFTLSSFIFSELY